MANFGTSVSNLEKFHPPWPMHPAASSHASMKVWPAVQVKQTVTICWGLATAVYSAVQRCRKGALQAGIPAWPPTAVHACSTTVCVLITARTLHCAARLVPFLTFCTEPLDIVECWLALAWRPIRVLTNLSIVAHQQCVCNKAQTAISTQKTTTCSLASLADAQALAL